MRDDIDYDYEERVGLERWLEDQDVVIDLREALSNTENYVEWLVNMLCGNEPLDEKDVTEAVSGLCNTLEIKLPTNPINIARRAS